ncbi:MULTISPECIES: hypothetical protein [unclassified Bacteroides]|uniref:hypothetical protein n=1 Tax=unclassified Bacteroides TaxID=2646097 RepID=UPI000E83E286|nr:MULTISPECIES: hypothetical protein [unclassified Bacteroides]RGN59249.1 hypothetical protein DXB58_14005 [Bacteroides sp. OM05-10AA]RGQ65024.1 hypothetical protein DWY87_15105 [Bacteroides sp. AF27-33]
MKWHSTHKKHKKKRTNRKKGVKISRIFALLNSKSDLVKSSSTSSDIIIERHKDPLELFGHVDLDDFARPTKNDTLFKEPLDYNDLSIIGRFVDRNDFMIISGFYDVAINSLQILKNKGVREKDSHIYPIIYNYRHYLELIIKQTIRYFRLAENEITNDEVGYESGHCLKKLWSILKTYLSKIEDVNQQETIAFDKLLNELNDIDENSFAFRYHCDKGKTIHDKIKLTISESKDISLSNLEVVMKKMHCYIEGISCLVYDRYKSYCEKNIK